MRKTLTALMFAAALPTLAMAMPEPGPHGEGPHHRGPAAFAQLDLTPEQRQQIGRLMGEQMKQRREITERYLDKLPAPEQKAMKDEIKAGHDKTQTQIRALLKPDQQKQFDELQSKRAADKAEWEQFQAWKAEKAAKAQ